MNPPQSSTNKHFIGLDIGGTKILGVLVEAGSESGPLTFSELATATRPSVKGNQGVLDSALTVVSTLLDQADLPVNRIGGIGIGIPGAVNASTGVVYNAVNLGLEQLELRRELEDRLGVPVAVNNDVKIAAIGAAHDLGLDGSVVYLNIGTGMAACLVEDGEIFAGTTGVAGEIGHLPVDPDGVPCGCGQVGCLETIASGSAITRQWPSDATHPSDELLAEHLGGNPEATRIFRSFASGIAQAVRVIVLSYDPEMVILGGGMRKLGQPLSAEITAAFEEWGSASPFIASLNLGARLSILPHESNAGATGAALMAHRITTAHTPCES